MKDWNVILTSHMHKGRRLIDKVRNWGEFQDTGFAEVTVGKVPDVEEFLEYLRRLWEEQPGFREILGSATPIRRVFPFTLENLVPRLQEETRALVDELGGSSFYVRMKRRGHKGELSSLEIEQELDTFLTEECTRRGQTCHIGFAEADKIIVIETVHNQCGLGLITREMKERYPFIKIK